MGASWDNWEMAFSSSTFQCPEPQQLLIIFSSILPPFSSIPKLSFPPFYQLEEGDQLEINALWVSTLVFVAGAHHEGFGFYANGTFFNDYNLLERDGTHLSRKGESIFGSRLANLVWRALN